MNEELKLYKELLIKAMFLLAIIELHCSDKWSDELQKKVDDLFKEIGEINES